MIRIHTQKFLDECSACVISAIAEDRLDQPVNPDYLYQLVKDDQFGIRPNVILQAAVDHGVQLEDGRIVRPFTGYRRIWGWFSLFSQATKALEKGLLMCNLNWQAEWDSTPYTQLVQPWLKYGSHSVLGREIITKDGRPYLKIQNSRGENVGDRGMWYMPPEVVNKFISIYQLQ